MSVTVVSCAYGRTFQAFFPRWWEYVQKLDPAPDRVIVAANPGLPISGPDVVLSRYCTWRHPQAYYLQKAIEMSDTDWVWQVDIDDCAMPDALAGLEKVESDVWQMGFIRSDGESYMPPQISGEEFLASERNVFVAGSAIRVEAFHAAGGFPDVALQDWALWRRLAANGATFESSGRTHFHYMRHRHTRGETELTIDVRQAHLAEMMASEAQLVA